MIIRVNVVRIGLLLLTVTDVRTTCAVVIFSVKVSYITSVDGCLLAVVFYKVVACGSSPLMRGGRTLKLGRFLFVRTGWSDHILPFP